MLAYKYVNKILWVATRPALLLIGYDIVLSVFARRKDDANAIDASAIVFASYALFAGWYCFRDLTRKKDGRKFLSFSFKRSPLLFFSLYTLWCMVSAFWSPSPLLTFYRAVECFCFMFVVLDTMRKLLYRTSSSGIALWVSIYAFCLVCVHFVHGYLSSGLNFALYNSQFVSTMFFFVALLFAPHWVYKYCVVVIALFCKSTTGYIGLLVGACTYLIWTKKYRDFGILLGVVMSGVIIFVGFDTFFNKTIFATKNKEVMVNGRVDMTKSSGRDVIWENAVKEVNKQDKEYYGLGFVAGETTLTYKLLGEHVIGFHNGFISAYVGTGIIGFVLFLAFMIWYIVIACIRKFPVKTKSLVVASMPLVFFHTLANPGLGFRVYGTWLPAMVIVCMTITLDYKMKKGIPDPQNDPLKKFIEDKK